MACRSNSWTLCFRRRTRRPPSRKLRLRNRRSAAATYAGARADPDTICSVSVGSTGVSAAATTAKRSTCRCWPAPHRPQPYHRRLHHRRSGPPADQAVIDFEFQGAPITAILDWYSRLTGRSIISAPNLNAQINFRSQSKLTKDEAIQALDSVLAINNIAAIPLGEKFLKIVQINTAKQEGLPVGRVVAPADTLGTQIIPLKNAKASEVVPVLQPYLHPYGQLMALQDSNSILISETAANLKQMMEIVTYVDQPSALRMEMRSYVLKHAKAADVMARLQTIIQEAEQAGAHAAAPGQPGMPPSPIRRPWRPAQIRHGSAARNRLSKGKVIMAADERTNKLFILTRISNFGFFDRLIAELDAKVEPDVVMKVILLNYATAEDVAGLLNALISGGSAPSSSSSSSRRTTSSTRHDHLGRARSVRATAADQWRRRWRGVPEHGFPAVRGRRPHPARSADELPAGDGDQGGHGAHPGAGPEHRHVGRPGADRVRDRRGDAEQRAGRGRGCVQAAVARTGRPLPTRAATAPTATRPSSSAQLASNLPTAATLALAGAGGLTYFTTFRNLNLDTVIHALATTSNSKVLSTPVIQTMDNQEADITVGESVPVPTSQTSSLVSGEGTLVRHRRDRQHPVRRRGHRVAL